MNKTVTITSRNHKHANTYGGVIYASDFNTGCHRPDKSVSWADRIVNDWAFDRQCRRNVESTNRKNGEKENA